MKKKIIEDEFAKHFALYAIPFQKADERILKMEPSKRNEYYRQAKENILCLDDEEGTISTWTEEIDDLIRTFYSELALKTTTELEQHAHRLTLIALKKIKTRMVDLAMRYKQIIK